MLSHLKRRVAQLSVVMLAATTLALVPASPAFAAVKVPLANAQFSACPASASIPAAGFTDTTSTDVDCVAYYGITTGTTATTYSPTESVTRWQMALFLTRAAVPAGVTLGAGTDDGTFTDVSGKSAEIITAIYQIKDLGITIGKTATTFAPDDSVNREEMALFINRFLAKAELGPGGANDSLADDDGLMGTNVGSASTTTNYTDIGTGTTFEGRNAITNLWHMGVTDDPSSTSTVYSTTYSPGADMTRAAMATFLTEALAHTNARPKGVTLQSAAWDVLGETADVALAAQGGETPTLSASYRDDSFGYAAGTLIDVWSYKNSTTVGQEQYLATGLCNTTGTSAASAQSVTMCYIDAGDQATNANGNTVPSGVSQAASKTYDYIAWTAATGTSYDNDIHTGVADTAAITVTGAYNANDVQVTSDIDAQALTAGNSSTVPFGKDITITIQAEYNNGLADANTTEALVACTLRHVRVITDTGNVAVYAAGTTTIDTTSILFTDTTGAASFTITSPTELSTTAANDTVTDSVTLSCGDGVNDGAATQTGVDAADWAVATQTGDSALTPVAATKDFVFKDTVDAVSSGALAQTLYYGTASTSGVTRTATFTAYDQYGDPWAGEVVAFSSAGTLIDNPVSENGTELWTTIAAHGLAVGDDLAVSSLNACALSPADGGTAVALDDVLTVQYATTSTTFSLKDAGGSTIVATSAACDNTTDGLGLASTSFASVSRTTGSAGTATVTWSDSEGTSGVDTITGDGAGLTAVTSEYYRTLNSTSTANTTAFTTGANTNTVADWTATDSTDAAAANRADTHLGAWIEYWDNANNVLVVGIAHGEISTLSQQTHYVEYAYDDNDQFTYGATSSGTTVSAGTATKLSTWEYYLNLTHSNATDNWTGTSGQGGPVHVDYEVLAASASVFTLG
jgi:hypothetical protein